MDALLARAMQGIDPEAPGAFWQVFFRLLNMLPWASMFWWSVVFVIVGAVLGWWRGRVIDGVVWACLLGPLGWIVIMLKPRPPRTAKPPPLPR